jgi:hypothetical protein
MADTPVIVTILNRVDLILSSIDVIGQVRMFPHIPTDRASAVYPACAIKIDFEDVADRNRLEAVTAILTVATLFRSTDSKENLVVTALQLEATIHKAIYTDEGLRNYVRDLRRMPPEIEYESDTEGVITQSYRLAFLHKMGDPFTNTNF